MSDVQHTPEPWKEGAHSSEIVAVNPDRVLGDCENGPLSFYGGQLIAESVEPRNRRRIVACVNACRGVENSVLERKEQPFYLKEFIDDTLHERDKALEKVDLVEHWKDVAIRERDEARAMVLELLTIVKNEEWTPWDGTETPVWCRSCHGNVRTGHKPDCGKAATIAKAEAFHA